jgi:hypothetical protein
MAAEMEASKPGSSGKRCHILGLDGGGAARHSAGMNNADCIFCKIIAGKIPCAKVFEDESALAFLDIAPFEKGHTLVIPKFHAETLVDLPEAWVLRLMPAVQKVGAILLKRMPCDGFNVLQSNGAARRRLCRMCIFTSFRAGSVARCAGSAARTTRRKKWRTSRRNCAANSCREFQPQMVADY